MPGEVKEEEIAHLGLGRDIVKLLLHILECRQPIWRLHGFCVRCAP